MKILGFQPESYIDWNEGLASVIYTGNCNYKCPTCHARQLMQKGADISEAVLKKLEARKRFVSKVVICGGEPTIQYNLPDFLRRLKKSGFQVKLDTNGSNPFMLGDLLEEKFVDYLALDIKGPPSLYRKLIGIEKEANILEEPKRFDFRDNLEKAIGIVQNAPDFELRTTFVPVYDEKGIRWMTSEEIAEMSDYVSGFIFTNPNKLKWHVQKFVSRSKTENAMLDDKFAKENLPEQYHATPVKMLESARDILRKRFPKAEIR